MIREIAIADCVHYCGFRYGRNEFNPYENYITGLAEGRAVAELREKFTNFIRYYRPKDIGEAISVTTTASVPLWLLPWKSWLKLYRPNGWQESTDVIDILTYFSPKGVEWRFIEREFNWLERAWLTIRDKGYLPERYGHIEVFELRAETASRFLVIDGNHRVSALHALGERQVIVRQPRFFSATRSRARFWPLVLSGHVPHQDALTIFDGYLHGNLTPHRAASPAPILY
ncbi:MAG: hypothetical protein IPL51_14340 [Candidatus Competibacteraceae bacterium]|nr:hypothetical protein [Candidatus Competibacteraceae bacterium]